MQVKRRFITSGNHDSGVKVRQAQDGSVQPHPSGSGFSFHLSLSCPWCSQTHCGAHSSSATWEHTSKCQHKREEHPRVFLSDKRRSPRIPQHLSAQVLVPQWTQVCCQTQSLARGRAQWACACLSCWRPYVQSSWLQMKKQKSKLSN